MEISQEQLDNLITAVDVYAHNSRAALKHRKGDWTRLLIAYTKITQVTKADADTYLSDVLRLRDL